MPGDEMSNMAIYEHAPHPVVKRITAVDEKRVFVGFEDLPDKSKEGRFSGAVGAEQPPDRPGGIEKEMSLSATLAPNDFVT